MHVGRPSGIAGAVGAAVFVAASLAVSAMAQPPVEASAPPVASGSAATVPYWQASAAPQTVIQGGAIPPGWQPQAIPYQGIGPDGRPLTVYLAPTYVFTYQSGPPVAVPPAVARPQAWGATPAATGGWNYSTSGAQPVPVTLPPAPAAGWGR